jgi:hypothetical protein
VADSIIGVSALPKLHTKAVETAASVPPPFGRNEQGAMSKGQGARPVITLLPAIYYLLLFLGGLQ